MDVLIKNFQIIEEASISLDGIVLLVGPNNNGKTSVVRAISAALLNASGNSFVRKGTDEAVVWIKFPASDSTPELVIGWTKGLDSGAKFCINGTLYTRVGRSTPDVLQNAGIKEVVTPHLRAFLNVWYQWESPFLLSDPSSHMFEFISYMRQESKILSAIRTMQSDKKQVETEAYGYEQQVQLLDKQIALSQTKLARYDRLLASKPEVDKMESLMRLLLLFEELYFNLEAYRQDILELDVAIDQLNYQIKALKDAIASFETFLPYLTYLIDTNLSLHTNTQFLKVLDFEYSQKLDFVRTLKDSLPLYEDELTMLSLFQDYVEAKSSLESCEKILSLVQQQRDNAIQEIKDLIEQNKDCPICGKPLSVEDVLGGHYDNFSK